MRADNEGKQNNRYESNNKITQHIAVFEVCMYR